METENFRKESVHIQLPRWLIIAIIAAIPTSVAGMYGVTAWINRVDTSGAQIVSNRANIAANKKAIAVIRSRIALNEQLNANQEATIQHEVAVTAKMQTLIDKNAGDINTVLTLSKQMYSELKELREIIEGEHHVSANSDDSLNWRVYSWASDTGRTAQEQGASDTEAGVVLFEWQLPLNVRRGFLRDGIIYDGSGDTTCFMVKPSGFTYRTSCNFSYGKRYLLVGCRPLPSENPLDLGSCSLYRGVDFRVVGILQYVKPTIDWARYWISTLRRVAEIHF